MYIFMTKTDIFEFYILFIQDIDSINVTYRL